MPEMDRKGSEARKELMMYENNGRFLNWRP